MPRIMIVDDEPNTVELTKAVLELNGFEPIGFTDPRFALDELKKGLKPDLIILDMRMPGISGPEFCKEIRRDETLKDIRIVFFTASSDEKADLLKEYNVLGFIFKPFDNDILIDQINQFLKKG